MIDIDVVHDFSDKESLFQATAAQVVQVLNQSPSKPVTMALSGGSSPARLFELLTRPPYSENMPWGRLAVFWVDERMVPYDHKHSNFALAKKWLLDHVPVNHSRVFPMPTDFPTPEAAAQAYEQTLRKVFPEMAWPRFDLVLLGMGPDGHIASLFPGDPALRDAVSWVTAVPMPGMPPSVPRLTLTLPVLNQARHILALVPGAGKRNAFINASTSSESILPAALLAPQGKIAWLTCFQE